MFCLQACVPNLYWTAGRTSTLTHFRFPAETMYGFCTRNARDVLECRLWQHMSFVNYERIQSIRCFSSFKKWAKFLNHPFRFSHDSQLSAIEVYAEIFKHHLTSEKYINAENERVERIFDVFTSTNTAEPSSSYDTKHRHTSPVKIFTLKDSEEKTI